MFQSTRPRGTRRSSAEGGKPSAGFNPRVREGRDHLDAAYCFSKEVSIHASARDATSSTRLPPAP